MKSAVFCFFFYKREEAILIGCFPSGLANIHLFWCDSKSCIRSTVSCSVPWNSMNNTFTCTVKKMCLLIPLPQHLCLFYQSKIKGDVHRMTFIQCFLSTRTQCRGLLCINSPNMDRPFNKSVVETLSTTTAWCCSWDLAPITDLLLKNVPMLSNLTLLPSNSVVF